ncbi:MAG: glycogen synthase [Fimbriimonadaceae bacterium]|nr:glycogen synthase [Fimbriimonadaceae bacterium]QYK57072.1 MAG: glycogen synthase [Fimbriimonadaceae bacterium]
MRILFLSAEVAPYAKVGGLADVAASLPKELRQRGHDVRIVMPAYQMVCRDPRWGSRLVRPQFPVRMNAKTTMLADLYEFEHDDRHVWMIDGDDYFDRIERSQDVYTPSVDAYLFYTMAALQACVVSDWIPDVVHANDWHTGFAPVLMRERFSEFGATGSCYTIHNLAYQGEFGKEVLETVGLPERLWTMDALETWGKVNFIKSGCVFADQVNTVSPTYAREIQTRGFGCNLHGLMRHLDEEGRLRGILNGIDEQRHDPATDPELPAHFSVADPAGKASCRAELIKELRLDIDETTPVMGVVSRLSDQKGFDLIVHGAAGYLSLGTALVVLGTGDPWAANELRRLEERYPGKVRFVEAYNAELAQRIYGGSDMFLMPSAFEPCGLGQMFAMRYGTIPVVRKTGGLADTVFENENGFVFDEKNLGEFVAAIARAVMAFRDPSRWQGIVRRAMEGDYSWAKSAVEYEKLYEDAVAVRKLRVESTPRQA